MRRYFNLREPKDKKIADDSFSPDNSLQIKQKSLAFISAGVACSLLSFGGTFVLYGSDQSNQLAGTYPDSIPSGLHAPHFSGKNTGVFPALKNDPAKYPSRKSKQTQTKPGHKDRPGKESALADKTVWIFYVNNPIPDGAQEVFQQFSKHLNDIQVIHLYRYELRPTGNHTPVLNQQMKKLLSTAQKKGILVYPTVNTGADPNRLHQLISSQKMRNAMVGECVKFILANRFDGLNLHVDSILQTDREFFALFVEDLSKKLHQQGKKISLSVALQPDSLKNTGLDLRRLGETCDEIKIISTAYRSEPVESFQWLDQILFYTKTQVLASKIYINLPAQGNILSSNTNQTLQTVGLPQSLSKKAAGSIKRDSGEKTYTKIKLRYTTHTNHDHNTESLKRKITFIKENHSDIGGIYNDIFASEGAKSLDIINDLVPKK